MSTGNLPHDGIALARENNRVKFKRGNPNPELVARIDARLKTLGLSDRKASMKAGLKPDSIRNIRRGSQPSAYTLAALARTLGVDQNYFPDALSRDELFESGAAESLQDELSSSIHGDYVQIATLNIRAGAGAGGFAEDDNLASPSLMPRSLIEGDLHGTPADFVIMDVQGQSMTPMLEDGDRVIVDRRKRNPSQGGVFAINDGHELVAKWIERVPKSDPPMLRIFSENKRFSEYTTTADQANIVGRIVWFARKL